MADDQDSGAISTTFPIPPPFYKHFTEENQERLRGFVEHASDIVDGSKLEQNIDKQHQLSGIPAELRFLIPPPPPKDGRYTSFGARYDVNENLPSLKSQGLEQLYPSPPPSASGDPEIKTQWTLDRSFYLRKIAKSILLNFLELVGILASDPSQFGPKIDHFNALFFNAHHLINEYRPHQARETIILLMEERLERQRHDIEKIKETKAKAEELLSSLGRETSAPGNVDESWSTDANDPHNIKRSESITIWQTLNKELASAKETYLKERIKHSYEYKMADR